jgi:enamine deaminase RidA (YjgF/YER057c/UK114 family)
MGRAGLILAAVSILAASAHAAPIVRTGAPAAPIASTVTVPAGSDLVYVSGTTPPTLTPDAPRDAPASYGDTKTQTVNALKRIDELLKAQGLSLADVVMMRVYLVGDPASGGKMDFAGMMAGYSQFFGTEAQPNKPARTTVQVSALANPAILVEIEVTAARPH